MFRLFDPASKGYLKIKPYDTLKEAQEKLAYLKANRPGFKDAVLEIHDGEGRPQPLE